MRRLIAALRHPVLPEARRTLREAWMRLDPEFRVRRQTVGRQEEGCGATIGVMPRCDFGCTGCYLGADANATEALPLAAIGAQMRLLRERLGPWGNLQLTDGEVTLRPVDELIELLHEAHRVQLVPMIMSHGDTFRRRAGLLERLMVEGGLEELSIHVDTTQRGRSGDAYAHARTEAELMPLRAEFADMIRRARRTTGRPLRVASTLTITADNIDEVPDVVRWFIDNADAFRLLSLLPAAQVGRTKSGVGDGVRVGALWNRIEEGLSGAVSRATPPRERQWWFGHPDCSRFVTGLAVVEPGRARYALVGAHGDPVEQRFFDEFFEAFGGISLRAGTRAEITARILGMVARRPRLLLKTGPRLAWRLLHRIGDGAPLRLAARLLTRRTRVHPLTVGTHHFMSAEELSTDLGRERLRNCIFTVPVEGRLVSMCEVNALGGRARMYARMRCEDVSAPERDTTRLTVGAT